MTHSVPRELAYLEDKPGICLLQRHRSRATHETTLVASDALFLDTILMLGAGGETKEQWQLGCDLSCFW